MFDSASRDLHVVSCLARGDDCAVCLCPLRPRHALAMPFCGHVLHAHCMLTERQCPLCRGAATVLWLRDRGGWRLRTAEMCDPDAYVALMADHGFAPGLLEMDSEYKRHQDHQGLTAPLGK